MKRVGKNILMCENEVGIISFASVVGEKEAEGPLGAYFDKSFSDPYLGEESFEKAESLMQKEALNLALSKGGLKGDMVDMIFAGDLLISAFLRLFPQEVLTRLI